LKHGVGVRAIQRSAKISWFSGRATTTERWATVRTGTRNQPTWEACVRSLAGNGITVGRNTRTVAQAATKFSPQYKLYFVRSCLSRT